MKRIGFTLVSLAVVLLACESMGGTIVITCDDYYELYVNGEHVGSPATTWQTSETWTVQFQTGENIVAVRGEDLFGLGMGLILEIHAEDGGVHVTDTSWKVAISPGAGWNGVDYDDSSWPSAFDEGPYDQIPWGVRWTPLQEFATNGARWIWIAPLQWVEGFGYVNGPTPAYFRKTFMNMQTVPAEEKTWGAIKAVYELADGE